MNARRIILRISTSAMGYCLAASLALQPLALARGQESRRLPPVEPAPILDAEFDGLRHRDAQLEATLSGPPDGTPLPLDEPVRPAGFWRSAATGLSPNRARLFGVEDSSIDIGGYVKADLIHDFNPIESKDFFDPLTIPTDGRLGENTRLHARQTRLSLGFRPEQDDDDLQLFVEGDFFGDDNSLRLRHAYLRAGGLLAGQTWTTFMDESILPRTLDFESPRSIILDRRALLRWTQPVTDCFSVAVALENPQPMLDFSVAPVDGDVERPAPDLISRFRYETERWHLQGAGLVRIIGFREESGAKDEELGWGLNFTGRFRVREIDSVLFQVAYGKGYESYRQAPDGAVDENGVVELNPVLAWVVGYEVDWTDRLSSTFVYSIADGTPASFQPASTAKAVEYLAANLVFRPLPRFSYGIEYLYGSRLDKDFARGEAHRVQFSVRYDLP